VKIREAGGENLQATASRTPFFAAPQASSIGSIPRCLRATTSVAFANIVKMPGCPGAPRALERTRGKMPTPDQQQFFVRFGKRVRRLRKERRHSQEDMISYGFSARHWQQIETGRPITVSTLLRICAVFEISVESLVRGLDRGIYRN
jgi:DNA-binding Xre family transcriptional regulator